MTHAQTTLGNIATRKVNPLRTIADITFDVACATLFGVACFYAYEFINYLVNPVWVPTV